MDLEYIIWKCSTLLLEINYGVGDINVSTIFEFFSRCTRIQFVFQKVEFLSSSKSVILFQLNSFSPPVPQYRFGIAKSAISNLFNERSRRLSRGGKPLQSGDTGDSFHNVKQTGPYWKLIDRWMFFVFIYNQLIINRRFMIIHHGSPCELVVTIETKCWYGISHCSMENVRLHM